MFWGLGETSTELRNERREMDLEETVLKAIIGSSEISSTSVSNVFAFLPQTFHLL